MQVAQFVVISPNVWQFTISSLTDGVYNITATIEDSAGNVGPPTAPLKVTIAQFSLTLPGNTVSPAGNPVVVDLAARTIQGFVSASPTQLIGIRDIPIVNLNANAKTLTVNLTAGDDSLGYTPSGADAGSIALAGVAQVINFSGAGVFTVNPLSGNDTVTTNGTAARNHNHIDLISGHRQRLVELAVTREAERLVQMQRGVVVGADVEADRLDAGELAQHGARGQAS